MPTLTPSLSARYAAAVQAAPEGQGLAALQRAAAEVFSVRFPLDPRDEKNTQAAANASGTARQWLATPSAQQIFKSHHLAQATRAESLGNAHPTPLDPINFSPTGAFFDGLAEAVPTVAGSIADIGTGIRNIAIAAAVVIGLIFFFSIKKAVSEK
jgi:hypothetical protein